MAEAKKKAASIQGVSELPPKRSTIDKLKSAETSQIHGPDADLMRDLKGKHMIGGTRRTGSGRKMVGKR